MKKKEEEEERESEQAGAYESTTSQENKCSSSKAKPVNPRPSVIKGKPCTFSHFFSVSLFSSSSLFSLSSSPPRSLADHLLGTFSLQVSSSQEAPGSEQLTMPLPYRPYLHGAPGT